MDPMDGLVHLADPDRRDVAVSTLGSERSTEMASSTAGFLPAWFFC